MDGYIMRLIFILFLIILLLSFLIGIAYSQSFIPTIHYQQYKYLHVTDQLDNFDSYSFSADEHIEEAEFIIEDDINNKYIIEKYSHH